MIGTSRSVWGFDPRSVPGCALWLDAADSSTVTGTTNVTQWRDKSGNARHLGVGSGTTTYSSNAIVLNSSYMFVNSPVDLSKVTVFIVVKTTGGNNQTVFSGRPNSNYEWDSLDGFGFFMDGQNSIRFYGQYANVSTFSVNTSTPQVFSFQSSGTSLTAWYNGVSQTGATLSSARTSTAQAFMVGASWSGSVYENIIANASLYEIIVYNSDVNTSQRQQIEGYLAHKWGLTTSVPSTHPFSSIRPHLRTFQPIDVPGCALWLDGADQSSMTLSGSNVTQWNDKSGNGYNAVANTGTVTTNSTRINGLNTIRFSTSSFLTISSFAMAANVSMFAVIRGVGAQGSGNFGYFFIGWGLEPSFFVYTLLPSFGNISGPFSALVASTGETNWYMPSSDFFLNNPGLMYIDNNVSFVNGSQLTRNPNRASVPNAVSAATYSNVQIGGRIQADSLAFDFAELLVYNTALTTSQRQQVEGYLAHKWGLSPSYSPTTPLSIPGCQLWLDAADSSTITLSTTKVTQWNDKSGNGYNFTQSTSGNQPTYSTSSLNNQNTITFTSANSTYLLGTASTNFIGTNSVSVYGVFKTNNNTSSSAVFSKSLYGSADGRILYGFREPGTPGTIIGGIGGQSSNAYTAISDTYTGGSWRVFGFVSDRSGWTNTTYQNGTSIGTATIPSNTTTNLTNAFPMLVGAYNNTGGGANPPQPGYYLDGGVGELLVFSTALTTTQRQQIEGYLARKWGISISATLPSTHPFKSFPPAVISETFTNTFTYTGGDQSFVVPTNVTSIKVYMWAGGGQGTTTINGSFYGGAGAYVQGVLTVTPGETLTIYVGQGGITGPTFSYKNGGYNSAGDAGTGTAGGRSGIARSSTNIVAVGAGGGGGGNGNGGAGGITSGSAGGGTNPGGGGTQSAGGSAGSSGYNSGGVGQNFGGGTGPSAYGGSGGDGFYGGGGGAAFGSGQLGGGGGGGSSLTSNLTSLVTFVSSNGYSAPNTNSRYYRSTIAAGGYGLSGTAGNGLVIITSSI